MVKKSIKMYGMTDMHTVITTGPGDDPGVWSDSERICSVPVLKNGLYLFTFFVK